MYVVLVTRRSIGRQPREHLRSGPQQRTADAFDEFLRDRADVITPIAVLGKRKLLAKALQVAQPDAGREYFHLSTGIVDVVLALHGETGGVEQVRERCAECGETTVTNMQRARGIRRNEFDENPCTAAGGGAPVSLCLFEHLQQFRVICRRSEEEIDEAGSCNVDLRDQFARRQCIDDLLGKLARLAPGGLGQLHRNVCREIAMHGVSRALDQ